ncbi:MAG TPA: antibiotic biosynthesis monooxygenase [Anaerolineales bacterium]|nr:antibiotic biosynthesis monooxygenase [Anaerolineales bacterium]
MHIVHVFVQVKDGGVEEFMNATIENARNSLQERGVARFDVIQQVDDPTRFLLVEVYRTEEAVSRHKETAHYAQWQKTVEPLMQKPRTRVVYQSIFPDESGWS